MASAVAIFLPLLLHAATAGLVQGGRRLRGAQREPSRAGQNGVETDTVTAVTGDSPSPRMLSGMPEYLLAEAANASCHAGYVPIMSDAATCQAAAASIGSQYQGSNSWVTLPSGCIFEQDSGLVWFNSQPDEPEDLLNYRLVCQLQPVYELGVWGCTTGFAPLTKNASACQVAASSLGVTYGGTGEWDYLPFGCVFNRQTDNQVWFNSQTDGSKSEMYGSVCEQVHPQPLYELAAQGASVCPTEYTPILSDASVCEVAALSMGLVYEGSQEVDYLPSGCVKYNADNRVWFNSLPNGPNSETYRLVCQQAQHSDPTTTTITTTMTMTTTMTTTITTTMTETTTMAETTTTTMTETTPPRP